MFQSFTKSEYEPKEFDTRQIGQNAKVGRTGLQWSDIDNCGNLYIGESAVHAIKSSPALEGNKAALIKQVDAIRVYCQERNSEAGLKGNEPNAYRFALVKAPNRDPFWIELPPFSEGVHPMTSLITGDLIVPKTATDCPQCGADDWKVHRKNNNGSIQYRCKSCGKTQTRK